MNDLLTLCIKLEYTHNGNREGDNIADRPDKVAIP